MSRPSRSAIRRKKIARLFGGFTMAASAAFMAYGQETSGDRPSGDQVRTDKNPLRARSATENVAFGEIISTDEHRLTLREGEGDAVTETKYQLSPNVRVYVRGKQVALDSLPERSRVRFPRASSPDTEITELYVEEADSDSAADASSTASNRDTPTPAPTRVVKDGDAPEASNDVVPPVELGATLQTTTEGIEIRNLDAISPLGEAGMKSGDFIKMAAGESVVTPEGLFRVLNQFDGGTKVEIVAKRSGSEMDFTVRLPEDHKKVLVDAPDAAAPVTRNDLTTSNTRAVPDQRLLRQIRETQEQQQAQLKYLYDGLMKLANAAGVNSGMFGNYPYAAGLPIGGFGFGTGTGTGSGGNCFGAIGFDANGNPVIGFNSDGTAIGVLGFNADGAPILGETTITTTGTGPGTTDLNGDGIADGDVNGDGVPDDFNGDGVIDDQDGDGFPPNPAVNPESPQVPPQEKPVEINNPLPPPPAGPPNEALGRSPRRGVTPAVPGGGAAPRPPAAGPATPAAPRGGR